MLALLLAQAQQPIPVQPTTPVGVWAAVGGMLVMIIGAVGAQMLNWFRFKREIADREADAELNVEIRDCLKQIEIGNTEHHGAILLALATTTCKAECANFVGKNKHTEKE